VCTVSNLLYVQYLMLYGFSILLLTLHISK